MTGAPYWYRRPGWAWHWSKGDGTRTAVCGANLLHAAQARDGMAQAIACKTCWKRYAAGFTA